MASELGGVLRFGGEIDLDVYRFARTHFVHSTPGPQSSSPRSGRVRGVLLLSHLPPWVWLVGPLSSEPVKCVARFPSRAPIVGCPYNAFGLVAV